MNITKYKKLNMTEHKIDNNSTKINKDKETEQHFYDGKQNRIQLNKTTIHFGEPNNKHIQIK